jgi:hypothetical protein
MNTTKSVYNKLFKEEATELASHEIELANINEFNTLLKQADAKLKAFNDAYSKLQSLVNPVVKNGEEYISLIEKGMDDGSVLFSKFKEIGLDFNATPEGKLFKEIRTKGNNAVIQRMVSIAKQINS